jgi:hypothetical protein
MPIIPHWTNGQVRDSRLGIMFDSKADILWASSLTQLVFYQQM